MYSGRDDLKGRVSPFRNLRIKVFCQLPAAYRRLTRLSSPVIAKASTTCTYSLDPITLSPQPFCISCWGVTGLAFCYACCLTPLFALLSLLFQAIQHSDIMCSTFKTHLDYAHFLSNKLKQILSSLFLFIIESINIESNSLLLPNC